MPFMKTKAFYILNLTVINKIQPYLQTVNKLIVGN